jgi:hypothetical protein
MTYFLKYLKVEAQETALATVIADSYQILDLNEVSKNLRNIINNGFII